MSKLGWNLFKTKQSIRPTRSPKTNMRKTETYTNSVSVMQLKAIPLHGSALPKMLRNPANPLLSPDLGRWDGYQKVNLTGS